MEATKLKDAVKESGVKYSDIAKALDWPYYKVQLGLGSFWKLPPEDAKKLEAAVKKLTKEGK